MNVGDLLRRNPRKRDPEEGRLEYMMKLEEERRKTIYIVTYVMGGVLDFVEAFQSHDDAYREAEHYASQWELHRVENRDYEVWVSADEDDTLSIWEVPIN